MKLHFSSMRRHFSRRRSFGCIAACAAAVLASLGGVPARADSWDKKTTLTISQTTQVKDTVLEPGQYVFKLLNSNSDRHVVQIFNADQSHIINTVLAVPNYRLHPTGDSSFTMWETPEGSAKAIRAWFYPGDNFGQEFTYPKQLRQLAMNAPAPALIRTPEAEPTATPEPAAEPQPQEQAKAAEPAPQRVELAQNNPPPVLAPAASVAEKPAEKPAELPSTASPFPLIGLGGLLSLGVFGVLRNTRPAG